MLRIGIGFGLVAVLSAALWFGVGKIREDARNDLLREIQIRQAERDARTTAERNARVKELEDADSTQLRNRACTSGLLPADACAGADP